MQTSSTALATQPPELAKAADVAIRSSDDRPESSRETISHAGKPDSGKDVWDAEKLDSASLGVDTVKKKKRAGSSDGQEDGGEKGRRPCDMCRKRKIRCTPVNEETDTPTLPADTDGIKCRGCLNLDIPCTYLYVNKRPGRPSKKDLENVEKEKEKTGQGFGKEIERGQKASKGKQKKDAAGAGRVLQQKPGTYASGSTTTLPSPGPGPSFAASRPASATILPSQQSQQKYLSPSEPTMATLFSPMVDLESHTRPEKRQRTESQHSHRSHEHQQPSVQFDESFSWTPGLSIGSFGDVQKEDEYDGQRYKTHSQNQGQTADLFGHVGGYTSHPNAYQAINSDVGPSFNESGPTPSYANQMNFRENETSLQPFVPDFASFTGMKPNKPVEERVYTNQGSQNHQQRGHAGLSFLATSANVPTQSENTEPTRHFQHQSYVPHRDDVSYPNHSHTQPYPDQSAPVHHRASSSHQPPGSVLMPDAFQEDTTASNGKISATPLPACPQIEDVTSWSNVSFFISLHLRYQHAIMPIIHKPTFNNDLALRLDRKDEMFRAFLLSLVAYVICQVPRSKMIGYFSQQELEALQSRCRAASRLLQDRQRTCNTLTRICIYILDYFYSQTIGDTTTATMLLSQGVRLAFCLGLHEPTPAGSNGENIDHVALQLRRRIFFQLYNTDKTDASSGMQILMNDFEGVPPYPLCIDDELITTEGNLPQPVNRPSYMTGFVANVQLMQILSECMRKHRTYQTSPMDTDVYGILRWIERAQAQMRQVIQDLPDVLGPAPPHVTMTVTDQSEMFATQRANLLITAVSAEFALLDLKALADPTHDISSEREMVGREMYSLLSSIPVEHLAANGESMRGKVLRIIIALLSNSASPEHWNQHVRDWWDIYSKVQFVQMIPMNVDLLLGSTNTL